MQVKHLLDLVSAEGYRRARDVKHFRDNKKCPVAVCVAGEGDYTHCLRSGSEEWQYGRYTPRAYFAVLAWQKAYERITKGHADCYAVEWVDVSEAFRSIKYLNKPHCELVREFRDELKRVIDSGMISVHAGRYDYPPPQENPNCVACDFVMENSMRRATTSHHQPEIWSAVHPGEPRTFTWDEVKDCYVDLEEIEEAFILGEDMRRCTDLDAKFLEACSACDVNEMGRLVDIGANMYATEKHGDSAATNVVQGYGSCEDGKSLETILRGIDCLLSRGYDLNFCGYDSCTALYESGYSGDARIIEALLSRGANPNEPSWIASDWGETAIVVWDKICTDKFLYGDSDGEYERVQYALLRYGSRPYADVEVNEAPSLDEIYRYDDPAIVGRATEAESGFNEIDRCLIGAAKHLATYDIQRALKFGARRETVDLQGRSIIQIALEDAMQILSTRKERQWVPDEFDYAEFVIAWISGFGNPYTAADEEFVNEFCTKKGFERMRSEILKHQMMSVRRT